MGKWDDKSNNEILLAIKQMEIDFEALKIKIIKDYDRLETIEKDFNEANTIIVKRLKGGA